MAKSQSDVLFERLRAKGLRKRVAKDLSQALSSAGGSRPSQAAQASMAATRKRKASQRSTAAKKAAKTRAKKS